MTKLRVARSRQPIRSLLKARWLCRVSDIFGTNIFDIALIFLVDLAYAGGAVLNDLGSFSVLAALLGTMITLIYVLGLVERRDPVIGRLGVDSLAVLVIYAIGAAFLFSVS